MTLEAHVWFIRAGKQKLRSPSHLVNLNGIILQQAGVQSSVSNILVAPIAAYQTGTWPFPQPYQTVSMEHEMQLRSMRSAVIQGLRSHFHIKSLLMDFLEALKALIWISS